MSRKRKLLLNTGMGFFKQIITVICGMILPRFFLLYYGSAVNGLVASITNFLGFITFLDMGVGAVVQANLYKPLADIDNAQISRIVKSSELFFRRLAYIFIGYTIFLCFIIPKMVDFEAWYTILLLLIISLSILAQYMFGMTYQLLLNADQKSYVQLSLQMVTILLNTVLSIFLMKAGATIHFVKLATAVVYILRPFGQVIYVHKHYDIDKKIKLLGEPIKQKWNGFSQHFAAVVCQNIDVVVLTLFSTLENVSIYSIYYNITIGVEQIILTAATGIESLFGNMIAKNENEKLVRTFAVIEWMTHTGVTFIFTIAALTITPFIYIYTRGITDADYINPTFGMLLVIAYGVQCLRVPYFRIIKAAGHFEQTQNGAYISAGLNIVITITLVFKYGLIGAALGTLVAMFYHTVYFVWYLKEHIIVRSPKFFFTYIISDSIVACISYFLTMGVTLYEVSYKAWLGLALQITVIVFLVSLCVNLIGYGSKIRKLINFHKRESM